MNQTRDDEAPRVAVIGAGAVGAVLASAASASGAGVTLCVRSPITQVLLRGTDGVVRPLTAAIATRPSEVRRQASVVFVATKATADTPELGRWLERFDVPGTVVVVARNGLAQASGIDQLLPARTVMPALVLFGAERIAPGSVTYHRRGPLTIPEGVAASVVAAALAPDEVPVQTTTDFHTASWRKLLRNVVGNPITALTLRRRSPELMCDAGIQQLAVALLTEAVCVAQADGAEIGFAEVDVVLSQFKRPSGTAGTSSLYDRLAGQPMESDAITGEVVRRGQIHGVPTPFNQAVLALLNSCGPA